jgi:hypothetical protein
MLAAEARRPLRDAEQDRIFLDNPFSFALLCGLCASAVNLQVTQKDETTGWKPVVPDRLEAYPPAKKIPAAREGNRDNVRVG